MILQVIRGENLPAADNSKGTSDPFVKVLYDTKEIGVTSRIKRSLDPQWDHPFMFRLHGSGPMYVVLQVFDYDELSSNELLGTLRVPFPSITEENGYCVGESSNVSNSERLNDIRVTEASQTQIHSSVTLSQDLNPHLCIDAAHRRTNSLTVCERTLSLVEKTTHGDTQHAEADYDSDSFVYHGKRPERARGTCKKGRKRRSFIRSKHSISMGKHLQSSSKFPILYIWSSILRSGTAKGRILCSIQYEEQDIRYLTQPYRVNIHSIFTPDNPRFQQIYMHLPSHWNPDIEHSDGKSIRDSHSHSSPTKGPFDCVFPWHEKVLYMIEEVTITFHINELNQGVLTTMVLTNYRLWFVPYKAVKGLIHEDVHTISIAKIGKATLSSKKRSNNHTITELIIENLDGGQYRITLSPLLWLRESARDSAKAEWKRIKILQNIVNEMEWLRMENSFYAPYDLTHRTVKHSSMNYHRNSENSKVLMDEIMERLERSKHKCKVNGKDRKIKHVRDTRQAKITGPEAKYTLYRSLCNRRRIRYDAEAEFYRQGALLHPRWRVCTLNQQYQLCATYPSFLMVPSILQDAQVQQAAMFRSKYRFPVLSWLHPRTGAPLCRSSQPNTGVLRSTNVYDKELIWAIRDASLPAEKCKQNPNILPKKPYVLQIVDARPEINAKSNALTGKGHESVKQYDRRGTATACITFLGIDNIHVVRNSFSLLSQALYDVEDSSFFTAIQKSRWLEHLCGILQGAVEVATHLDRGEAVLVHCSDGWDRTAQLCSLAQVMLDPYFRTMEGFAILIEKDWCSFGHMFRRRCGHPTSDQTSPIFLQFLDAMYQLLTQFPVHFQFNELFLSMVAEAVYSSWFNTFQMNSEQERRIMTDAVPSLSVWDILRASTDRFRNPLYQKFVDAIPASVMQNEFSTHSQFNPSPSMILPVCRVRCMQLWCSHYQKAIGHMRTQQREIELLKLMQQQEEQLSRMYEVLTLEQRIALRMKQLQSEIAHVKRSLPNADILQSNTHRKSLNEEPKTSSAPREHKREVSAEVAKQKPAVTSRKKRGPAVSVDFCDLHSLQNQRIPTPQVSGHNGADEKSTRPLSKRLSSFAVNNLPNAQRRRSAARHRSNSMRAKRGILSYIIGSGHSGAAAKHEQPPQKTVQMHSKAVRSAEAKLSRGSLDHVNGTAQLSSPLLRSSSNSQREKRCDSLKEEMHVLEDQLKVFQLELQRKEDDAKLRLRQFRCFNYGIPNKRIPNSNDTGSPPLRWDDNCDMEKINRRNSDDSIHVSPKKILFNKNSGTRRRNRLRSSSWNSILEHLNHNHEASTEAQKMGHSYNSAPSTSDAELKPGPSNAVPPRGTISFTDKFRSSQPIWERDGDATCCKRCKKKFKAFYRGRHHCRCCGYVFCGRCTSNRMNLPEFGYYEVVRVCDVCYNSDEGEQIEST